MKTTRRGLVLIALSGFMGAGQSLVSAATFGRVPGRIKYSGTLMQQGKLANGQKQMQFTIHSTLATASPIWDGNSQSVTVSNGLFTATLGNPLIRPTNLQVSQAYLEMSVDGVTLSPREEIVSVPFALKAGEVEGISVEPTMAATEIYLGVGAPPQLEVALNIGGDVRLRPASNISGKLGPSRLYAETLTGATACASSAACTAFCAANPGLAVARVRLRVHFGDSDVILGQSSCYLE